MLSTIEFAAKRRKKKTRNCTKGYNCGNSYTVSLASRKQDKSAFSTQNPVLTRDELFKQVPGSKAYLERLSSYSKKVSEFNNGTTNKPGTGERSPSVVKDKSKTSSKSYADRTVDDLKKRISIEEKKYRNKSDLEQIDRIKGLNAIAKEIQRKHVADFIGKYGIKEGMKQVQKLEQLTQDITRIIKS